MHYIYFALFKPVISKFLEKSKTKYFGNYKGRCTSHHMHNCRIPKRHLLPVGKHVRIFTISLRHNNNHSVSLCVTCELWYPVISWSIFVIFLSAALNSVDLGLMAFIAADIHEQTNNMNNKGYLCQCVQCKETSSCLFSRLVYLNTFFNYLQHLNHLNLFFISFHWQHASCLQPHASTVCSPLSSFSSCWFIVFCNIIKLQFYPKKTQTQETMLVKLSLNYMLAVPNSRYKGSNQQRTGHFMLI